MKNSVPSEVTTTSGGEREKQGNVSSKTVLSGPEEEGTYNRFSCFAVHSKMSQSTNAKGKPMEGLYTDTDPDDRSEIITDVTIRMPGKAGTMKMEVKVDPGAQPSCISLHKFKTLFPHLCRDGLPKEVAKFFTPTSDEEENSHVNNRTRCKKLFEPKKEEESEK